MTLTSFSLKLAPALLLGTAALFHGAAEAKPVLTTHATSCAANPGDMPNLSFTSNGVQNLSNNPITIKCPINSIKEGNGLNVWIDGQTFVAGTTVTCSVFSRNFTGVPQLNTVVTMTDKFDKFVPLSSTEATVFSYQVAICTLPRLAQLLGFTAKTL